MDDNKRATLKKIDFKVSQCCALCIHSTISPGQTFGDCRLAKYEHLKHHSTKQLSVTAFGTCPKWEESVKKVATLHGFAEFMDLK